MMRIISLTATAVILLATVLSCSSNLASKKRTTVSLPPASKVAVLPFENLSGTENAAEKLTDYFMTNMTGRDRFETIEFGSLYQILRRHRIRSAALLTEDQIASLASDLDVDYILTGSALEYAEYDNSFLGRVPQVSFNCRLIDCATNKTVWVANSNGRGDKGELLFGIGAVKSADNLARKMVTEAVNDLSAMFARP